MPKWGFDASRPVGFQYQALAPDGPSIRLINLRKGSPGDGIHCDIQISYIGSKCLKYDAIYYHWGTGERTADIYVSGKLFKASPTVQDILLRLRSDKEDRLLWLDLICIDQSNFEERSSPVEKMREIFGEAETVIVSLGPHQGSDDGSSLRRISSNMSKITLNSNMSRTSLNLSALGSNRNISMTSLSSSTPRTNCDGASQTPSSRKDHNAIKAIKSWDSKLPNPFPLSQGTCDDLCNFLSRRWFDRAWVLQEVAVERRLIVVSGKRELDGKEFAKFYGRPLLHRIRLSRHEKLRERLTQLRPLFEYVAGEWSNTHPKPELLTVLHQFRAWKATDARDKVFALLGLSRDGVEASLLKPDYSYGTSVEDVYRRVARCMMTRHGSLSVLTYATPPTNDVDTARWLQTGWLHEVKDLFGLADPVPTPAFQPQWPSWCPDWRLADLPGNPEPPSVRSGSVADRDTSFARDRLRARVPRRLGDRLVNLRVYGCTIASVHAAGSVEVVIPKDLRKLINDIATTSHEMSTDLTSLSNSVSKGSEQGLRKNDQVCILEGTTGVAILRPRRGGIFQLINLRHSDFVRVGFDADGCLVQDDNYQPSGPLDHSTYASMVQRIKFGQMSTSRGAVKVRPQFFEIV